MRHKQLPALVLILAMLVSLVATPAAAAGNWYDGALNTWVERGVIQGDAQGNLNPTGNITRAEMATMLGRIMGYQSKGRSTFADVQEGAWYADAVLRASGAGVLQGAGGLARPNDKITRQEAAVMLARVLDLTGGAASFSDQGAVASWAADAVGAMAGAGYIQGANGLFRPVDSITRAEAMTILNNMFVGYYAKAGAYTADVKGSAVINADGVILSGSVTGDLVVAEGVGEGHIELRDFNLGGRLIVRGGGENSIVISGASHINTIYVARQDGKVRLAVEGGASVSTVVIDDGSSSVKVEGTVDTVTLAAPDVAVEITGTVKNVQVAETATASTLTVAKGATVDTVTTAAADSTVRVAGSVTRVETASTATGAAVSTEKGATIRQVVAAGAGTTVTGSGKVESVAAKGNNVAVTTPNTKVTADKGVTGTTAGGNEVAGGATVDSGTGDGTPKPTPPSGGGGGGGGGDGPSVTKYTVTFDENLGTGAVSPKHIYSITAGATVTAPTIASREAYTLSGWNTKADGTGTTYTVTQTITVNGAMTLYALWTAIIPDSYTVTFAGAEGVAAQTVVSGEKATKPDPDPAKEGYTFEGWFTAETGGTEWTFGTPITQNTTLYARWEEIPTTIEVSTPETLTEALANEQYTTIEIKDTLGSDSAFTVYKVNRAVTLKGTADKTVYGTFTVKADGVVFDGVNIQNKGDDAGGEERNAINAYCKTLTVKNGTFTATGSSGLANGLLIFPSDSTVTYTVKDNTFKGYKTSTGGYSSSAFVITESYTMSSKPFFGEGMAANAASGLSLTPEQNKAFVTENTYEDCKIDYVWNSWADGNTTHTVFCTSVTDSDNLRLSYGSENGATYYILGHVTYNDSQTTTTTLKANSELVLLEGATLAMAEGKSLVNKGVISVYDEDGMSCAVKLNTVDGAVKLMENITLTDTTVMTGTFTGTLDGNGKTVTVCDDNGDVWLAGDTTGTTVVKNLHINHNDTTQVVPMIGYAEGTSVLLDRVIVDAGTVVVGAQDNNESAYLVGADAGTTTFKDCVTSLNYMTRDVAGETYLSPFVGGSVWQTLKFEGTNENRGNVQVTYAGLIAGNGYAMKKATITVAEGALKNYGKIEGLRDGKVVAPISTTSATSAIQGMNNNLGTYNGSGGSIQKAEAKNMALTLENNKLKITAYEGTNPGAGHYILTFTALANFSYTKNSQTVNGTTRFNVNLKVESDNLTTSHPQYTMKLWTADSEAGKATPNWVELGVSDMRYYIADDVIHCDFGTRIKNEFPTATDITMDKKAGVSVTVVDANGYALATVGLSTSP